MFLCSQILTCISTMVMNFPSVPIDIETLRAYFILPLYHQFLNPKNCDILQIPFGEGLLQSFPAIGWYYFWSVYRFCLANGMRTNILLSYVCKLELVFFFLNFKNCFFVTLTFMLVFSKTPARFEFIVITVIRFILL